MEGKSKLIYLIASYLEGKCSTVFFAENFTNTYNLETNYDELTETERENFRTLNQVTSRYSPFEEDRKKYDCYYGDNEVKEKVLSVKRNLNL